MKIGDLRRRVDLETQSLEADGAGGQQVVWTKRATLWAKITPIVRKEMALSPNFERRLTHEITVRYRPDILTGMRLVYGTRLFTVRVIINQSEANAFLTLLAEEGGTL